jgi:hypothetical protein
MKKKFVIITAIFLIFSSCQMTNPSSATKVVNGIEEQSFPYVVSLLMDGKSRCTGTFLSDAVLLTAAHCVDTAKNLEVLGVKIDRKDFFIHPNWPSKKEQCGQRKLARYDVALIRLPSKTYDTKLGLPGFASASPDAEDPFKIVGFGHNSITVFNEFCKISASKSIPGKCDVERGIWNNSQTHKFDTIYTFEPLSSDISEDSVGCPSPCNRSGMNRSLRAENIEPTDFLTSRCGGNYRDRGYAETGLGVKRSGENKITHKAEGVLRFSGRFDDQAIPGIDAVSGAGDSGGPLFIRAANKWAIAGVTHGGGLQLVDSDLHKYSIYVDLNSTDVLSWIHATIKEQKLIVPSIRTK